MSKDCGPFFIDEHSRVELYVIGYKSMGESLILNIANQFYGVIDCYKKEGLFLTDQILRQLEVDTKKLDFICWTHADEDHSKGLSELFEPFVSKEKTMFILPAGVSDREVRDYLISSPNEEYGQIFEFMETHIDPLEIRPASQENQFFQFNLLERLDGKRGRPKTYTCRIKSFAPLYYLIRQLQLNAFDQVVNRGPDKLHQNRNFYSVGLKIEITSHNTEPLSICLAGDVDNETIRMYKDAYNKSIFDNNVVLKIPHHCSNNSDDLIRKGWVTSFKYAVTTSYKRGRSNLPDEMLLGEYQIRARSCGGEVSSTAHDSGHEYGVVKYSIPIVSQSRFEMSSEHSAGAAVV